MSTSTMNRDGDRRRGRRGDLLGAQVAQELAASLSDRGLTDGDPLPSEASLAEEYDVSQRVIREALRTLSLQGIVRTSQGRRAVVSRAQPQAIKGYFELSLGTDGLALGELLAMRQVIETAAAGAAATRTDEQAATELDEMLAALEQVTDPAERTRLDIEFHERIVALAGNRYFDAIVVSLRDLLQQERRRGQAHTPAAQRRQSQAEHRAIVAALRAGDADAAVAAMRHHLEQVHQRFPSSAGEPAEGE
ncbi:FadR/GntR family transcriptional regulator [Propionibacteriaceae bacterium Y2011]|uniref:FadR/GntR family transcriptional regulator n=1 Tax=Microlunatus sp. Y2014 TaxID=3418488 RepID=UPI003B4ADFD7